MDFYHQHGNFYAGIETDSKNAIGDTNYVVALEWYYGEKKQEYQVIPSPLFHGGGYGPLIHSDQGDALYNICGPMSVQNNQPDFGDKGYVTYLLLHEFGHSFVNPVTATYRSEINQSSAHF